MRYCRRCGNGFPARFCRNRVCACCLVYELDPDQATERPSVKKARLAKPRTTPAQDAANERARRRQWEKDEARRARWLKERDDARREYFSFREADRRAASVVRLQWSQLHRGTFGYSDPSDEAFLDALLSGD